MSATHHLAELLKSAKHLDDDMDTLIQANRAGKVIDGADLSHIRRMTTVIRSLAALAEHDFAHMPALERRVTVTPSLPTLPQLLAPAQKALDDYHDRDVGGEAAVSITFRNLP